MLNDLHIRDFVIAQNLHLEFADGLTVLTGETGAGKSILVGALALVLGSRADSQSVRTGADSAQISAVFDLSNNALARSWLSDNSLDSDDDCIIRRVVQVNGRSKAYINGKPTPLAQLKEFGALLVDIHGQHEHQSMLKASVQRMLLDTTGKHGTLLKAVESAFLQWKEKQQRLDDLTQRLTEKSARLDLLKFQTEELQKLDIQTNEYIELSDEHYRLTHVASIAEAMAETVGSLSGDVNGSQSSLAKARRALAQAIVVDGSLSEFDQLLESAEIQIEEAVSSLQRYNDDLQMDPQRRDFVENRLDAISGLAKKHRVEAEHLIAHFDAMRAELKELDHAEESLAQLDAQLAEAAKGYLLKSKRLTQARRKSAKTMAAKIGALVQQLGMPECQFSISVTPNVEGNWRADGVDTVEFAIQANQGEAPRPVAKVASGGELSRLSLAVQVISAATDNTTCMVFDEIDAGVGGSVADMIGQRLQELGQTRQVLSVTHLPQVACHGHQHFQVAKTTIDKRTRSQVVQLGAKERIEELARMLGGAKVTATTRRHAKELLSQAKTQRRSA